MINSRHQSELVVISSLYLESALQILNATLVSFLLVSKFCFCLYLVYFLLFQTLVNFTFLSIFQKQKNSSQVCHLIRGLYNSKVANYERTEILISKVGTVCVDLGYQEKEMTPHSSTLAWKIPGMEEPGRLQSIGSLRVGHDWVTSLSLFTFMHLRRKWQPTPVFLPGESQGRGSMVGCRLWGRTESDTTEVT